MKIASITLYCNESFRLNEWITYVKEYRNELFLHIIVNNGDYSEMEKLQSLFPDSIVLYSSNKSLTMSYNLALRKILQEKFIDAIMLITNDIQINRGEISKLYQFLLSDKEYGMVSPVLMKKESELIESFGVAINKNLYYIPLHDGLKLNELKFDIQLCDTLPGGMNLAKREFYEKVGFQDEYIFMYSDEVDMGIRGKKAGFKFAANKNIKAWHQHKFPEGKKVRNPLAAYLWGRNEIYLAKKHFSNLTIISSIIVRLKHAIMSNLSVWLKNKDKELKIFYWNFFKGILAGAFSLKKIPKHLLK